MEISTVNEILFPPFLFSVIFSFLCCQFHSLTISVKTPLDSAATPQIETTMLQFEPPQIPDELIASLEPEAEGQEQAQARELVTTDPSLIAELEATIDLNKLSLRACRAIAGKLSELDKEGLGISQKVNGSDKPASQLVAEVKNRFKKDPAAVAPVIRQYANSKALIHQDKSQNLEPSGIVRAS